MYFPSGEKATLVTYEVCPSRVSRDRPVCKFHNFTVLSHDPEAIYFPSGEKVTLVTYEVCPIRSGLIDRFIPLRLVFIMIALIKTVFDKLTFERSALVKLVASNIPYLKLAPLILIKNYLLNYLYIDKVL
jgi:hypothetical protein